MNIRNILTSLAVTAVLVVSPVMASAQTVTPSQKEENQASRLANLHTVADNAISMRLTSLNAALTRINGLVKLSSSQKAQFAGEITADINGLTSLKAKCDSDTDINTLRADYKSIFTQYRVYYVFLPQLHLLTASDTMSVTTDKLNDLANKLQDRIIKAGNPANLTGLLSDMQAKIADAEKQYSTVETQITPLTPQSYDNDPAGTLSTLKNARTEIQTGAGDLRAAASDAKQIIQALKSLSTSPAPTGS